MLESTPTIVTPAGVAGLTFLDEADAANKAVADLKSKGVEAIVLVIHEGGAQAAPAALNGCAGNLAGSAIADIVTRLDPAINVIVSAHTHNEYRCTITADGVTRLVTSASSFGRVLTDITPHHRRQDRQDRRCISAQNLLVENALNVPGTGVVRQPDPSKEDPQVAAVVSQYVTASAPLANKVIGRIQGDLTRTASPFGESALGDVIADGQLAATVRSHRRQRGHRLHELGRHPRRHEGRGHLHGRRGAGRGDLRRGLHRAALRQQPGHQDHDRSLDPQGAHPAVPGLRRPDAQLALPADLEVLQVRAGSAAAACDAKIGRMFVNGTELLDTDSIRVTMNNFLATGGDGYGAFNEGTDALGGAQDIDAFVAAFAAAEPAGVAVPALDRVVAKPAP